MVHVEIVREAERIKGFSCRGHAGFADKGKDIVCSAVSVLVINTVNSIEALLPEEGKKMEVVSEDEKGIIECRFLSEPSKDAELLLNSMYLGLKTIEKEYGSKFLKITEI